METDSPGREENLQSPEKGKAERKSAIGQCGPRDGLTWNTAWIPDTKEQAYSGRYRVLGYWRQGTGQRERRSKLNSNYASVFRDITFTTLVYECVVDFLQML
jgi:hypothetical protein